MINVLKAWELMRKQWLGNIVKKEKVRIYQMQIKEPWKQQTNPQMIFNLLPPCILFWIQNSPPNNQMT